MPAKFWLSISFGAWLQLGVVAYSSAVDGVNSVDQLLSKLSHTVQERNYRGLFTYEYGGTLDTLEIVHLVRDGREYERLQHLSGPSREIFRSGREITCVSIGAQLLRGGLFSPRQNSAQLHQYYDFGLGDDERIAGRTATIVRLIPKDQYRYGLWLSVDKATGFPVKTLVVNESRNVLERIQFIELDFDIDASQFPIAEAEGSYKVVPTAQDACGADDESPSPQAAPGEPVTEVVWHAQWLPQGFVLSEHNYSARDGYQHTYTDGLSSFSVFITPGDSDHPAQPGLAQRGATVALMVSLSIKNHPAKVAVVGEIPPVTAEQVALNMRPVAEK